MTKRKYKMKKITFTPHEDIKKIPDAFRKKWSAALRESKQAKQVLAKQSGAMCCLGVACDVVNIPLEDMVGKGTPLNIPKQPLLGTKKKRSLNIVDLQGLKTAQDASGTVYGFVKLNDDFLTHPQIADLLDGKEVTIRKREYLSA